MLDTGVLVVVLALSTVASLVAGWLTVRALADTRQDLRYVRDHGIGNGRRAAAVGEHRMAWARLMQAVISSSLTGLMIYIAAANVGFGQRVPAVWVSVVALVALGAAGIAWKAVEADRIRRRVLQLGIVEERRLP